MIKAITFDFWDTLVFDDSDEPKRAAQGLKSKAETRLQLLTEEVTQHHTSLTPERIAQAFEFANQRFRHNWKVESFTPTVAERLLVAYDYLEIDRTPGFDRIVREVEDMEVYVAPDFVPNVNAALAELAQSYKLGIISDAIHTPGRGLRQLLERQGLLQFFSCFIFSDEAGASKPAPRVFELAAEGLSVALAEIVHVGDRESNDVDGPLALGLRAILYTGAVDRGSTQTRANAVCRDLAELPAVVKNLDADRHG